MQSNVHGTFFSDHGIVFVIGVVGIAQTTIGSDLKLHVLMAEPSLVTHVVSAVEIVRHLSYKLVVGAEISLMQAQRGRMQQSEKGNWERQPQSLPPKCLLQSIYYR
jgi:hypothetical protein